ncbi:hypothetical protein RhiirA5_436796 [Rhizophagus irregularis]|uniref:Uncharacterized protein n=1 Tax=Rhizophagus irregularis TaxID=588596 RepID=A0A2N0NLE2_9GLOM|nr:hypothetical protein RhiirA5_436796 [Rhizophagus irregularis]
MVFSLAGLNKKQEQRLHKMINNRVTHRKMLKQCQVLSIFLKNNQNNNASSSIQHASNEQLQQTQNKHKMNSETIELAYEKRDFQKDLDNLEEIVESLTNEENVNVFLVRQRLRFTKENLNN